MLLTFCLDAYWNWDSISGYRKVRIQCVQYVAAVQHSASCISIGPVSAIILNIAELM